MKWFIFRNSRLVVLLLLFVVLGTEQCIYAGPVEEKRLQERHERKVQKYKQGWARLIPQYEKIQYAGSMGLISLGVGWDLWEKRTMGNRSFSGLSPVLVR